MKIVKLRKSEPWGIKQLKQVLKNLKTGKSRDPHGLINELFKPEVSGIDFKISFLRMANEIKENLFIPDFMQYANIVSICKGKGKKMTSQMIREYFWLTSFEVLL